MTDKRYYLNIGLFLFAFSLIMGIIRIFDSYNNSFLVSTEGTVIEQHSYSSSCVVEYSVNGINYTDDIHAGSLNVGDNTEICYDSRKPSKIAEPSDNVSDFLNLIFLFIFYMELEISNEFLIALFIIGTVLIAVCHSAFKGYKTEFLDRFSDAVMFSIISSILYAIFLIIVFIGDGDIIQFIALFAVCPITIAFIILNIIIWKASVKSYQKRHKLSANTADKTSDTE